MRRRLASREKLNATVSSHIGDVKISRSGSGSRLADQLESCEDLPGAFLQHCEVIREIPFVASLRRGCRTRCPNGSELGEQTAQLVCDGPRRW
jgi:hypothetical protein